MEDDGARNLNRMKSLSSAYYGVSKEEEGENSDEARANADNIDSSYFNVDSYVSQVLKKTPYLQLLDYDENVRKQIMELDGAMQLLVYENYSKFIGATDTMQNMKEKLVKMESQVSGLESKMDAIATATRRMNERNASKRSEVARLDRLGRLVGNLSSLFELPKKLRTVTNIEELKTLVKYYKSALPYLDKHKDIPSFAKIDASAKDASQEIVTRLKQKISGSSDSMSEVDFDCAVEILLDLGEKGDLLAPLFFRFHSEYIFSEAAPKEEVVKETFQSCAFLLKTTMFEPLTRALVTAETFFPEKTSSPTVSQMKMTVAKEVVRGALDRFRARFDAEPCTFPKLQETTALEESEEEFPKSKEEDSLDNILQALEICMKEITNLEHSLPSQELIKILALGDRAQELAERVLRQEINATMNELRYRSEKHLSKLSQDIQPEEYKHLFESVIKGLLSDGSEVKTHILRLFKKGLNVLSQEIVTSNEDAFRLQLQDWCNWLADSLKQMHPSSSSSLTNAASTLLAQAMVGRILASRVNELGLLDPKNAAKVLRAGSDDALKSFCSWHGVKAAESLKIPAADSFPEGKPTAVGDGVVALLNYVLQVTKILRSVGIPIDVKSISQLGGSDGTYARDTSRSSQPRLPRHASSAGTSAMTANIQRLFSEKIVVFDKVEFEGTSIAGAILRVALKTWFENIREHVLSKNAFQQIQLDANFVRQFVPLITGESAGSVNKVISEVVSSARERSVDPATLDSTVIDALCSERREDVKMRSGN